MSYHIRLEWLGTNLKCSDDEMINDDYHENTDDDTKLDKVLLARLVTTPALAKLC